MKHFHTGMDVVLKGHLPVNALVCNYSLYALSTEDSYVNLGLPSTREMQFKLPIAIY